MKKIIFLAALLLTTSSSLLAEEQSLLLNVRYADPIDLIGKGPGTDHRSPARKPTIFVSDRTFILIGTCHAHYRQNGTQIETYYSCDK